MKLSFKLNLIIVFAAAIIVSLALAVSGVTLYSVNRISKVDEQLKVDTNFELRAQEAKFFVVQIQQFLTDASLTREEASIGEAKENLEKLEESLNALKSIKPDQEAAVEKIREEAHKLTEVGLEMTLAYWQEGQEAGNAIMQRTETGLDVMSEKIGKSLDDLSQFAQNSRKEASLSLDEAARFTKIQTVVLSLILLLTSTLVFAVIFIRLRPLSIINEKLSKNVVHLNEASVSMEENSKEIKRANSEQASATQQTAASLMEIRAMVSKTAENSMRLKEGSITSQDLVDQGKDGLQMVQQRLQEIDTETQKLISEVDKGNKEVFSIVGIIREIGSKTKVINDIVFQTKLLSFNASVEAARAGEHGKGFAVVAEEVGSLASMSGQAAKEISDMLVEGTSKVESIIEATKKRVDVSIVVNKEKISQGLATSSECQETFNKIIHQVGEVRLISDEITKAIEEQRTGLEEISRAISSLESLTMTNVKVSQTVAGVSEDVGGSVTDLSDTISEISSIILGQEKKAA